MEREDIKVVINAFKGPKNCQNREHKLYYEMVGVYYALANLLTICMKPPH
jgi:hypothetical protein